MIAPTTDLAGLTEEVRVLASGLGRPDLAARVGRMAARYTAATRQVLVVGEYKTGKSSLVNALVNADVCPVDDDDVTVIPTVVSHASRPAAALAIASADGEPKIVRVTVERARRAIVDPDADDSGRARWAELRLPRRLLAARVALVDTPGVGGLDSPTGTMALAAADAAPLTVFVTEATRELTGTELAFLQRLHAACPAIVVAVTKLDVCPHWRRLVDALAARLHTAGLDDVALVPTSALLRRESLRRDDRAMNARSGYPRLVEQIRAHLGDGDGPARRLAGDIGSVCEELRVWCRAERESLDSPHAALERRRSVENARRRVAQLRAGPGGWQQRLADGSQALATDADHDMRSRIRRLAGEMESATDDVDPATAWIELRHLFERRVTEEIVEHERFVARRARELAVHVGEHFGRCGDAPVAVAGRDNAARDKAARGVAPPDLAFDTPTIRDAGLTALRGSYGGVLMFGLVSSLVGLAMINPVTVAAGFGLGRRAVRDERARQLGQRRAQAKAACRKALDEIAHDEGKRSRDAVRDVHRRLRDAYTELAAELTSVLDATLAEARTASADDTERRRRRGALHESESRLVTILHEAEALALAGPG